MTFIVFLLLVIYYTCVNVYYKRNNFCDKVVSGQGVPGMNGGTCRYYLPLCGAHTRSFPVAQLVIMH